MMTTAELDKKIDNIQDQIDMMRREDSTFKGYVHRQFGSISQQLEGMATKDDLYKMEARLRGEMATKQDLDKLTTLVEKIAEKVDVIENLVSR